jgi:hypothetical protein
LSKELNIQGGDDDDDSIDDEDVSHKDNANNEGVRSKTMEVADMRRCRR